MDAPEKVTKKNLHQFKSNDNVSQDGYYSIGPEIDFHPGTLIAAQTDSYELQEDDFDFAQVE